METEQSRQSPKVLASALIRGDAFQEAVMRNIAKISDISSMVKMAGFGSLDKPGNRDKGKATRRAFSTYMMCVHRKTRTSKAWA